MRTPLIAGNWKMNLNIFDSIKLATELKGLVAGVSDREILICPSFTTLSSVNDVVKGSNVILGAQNVCQEEKGAFTAEISPSMLKEVGCSYVIVGHSERRHVFDESNDLVNLRLKNGLKNDLKVILCVGETLDQREANETNEIIVDQIQIGLKDVSAEEMNNVVIAYEPVWAIGTGKTASPEQAQEVHAMIRQLLTDIFYSEVSSKVRILYGGSVKPDNATELLNKEDIDGALVGGAALDADSFSKIVKY
jgi:triosephosphate isomerase (TIM)